MAEIQYEHDKTGNLQRTKGSDGRLNTSSRSDGRPYYNSRDDRLAFTLVFDHQSAVAGEHSVYWKNIDASGKQLVISAAGINAVNAARVKLHFVTGDAADGVAAFPGNLNEAEGKDSSSIASARTATSGSGISGLSIERTIDFAQVTAGGHEEFRLHDTIRLGKGDAISIEYCEGTTGDFFGVIFGYYE